MDWTRIFLIVNAAVWLPYGLWCFFAPETLQELRLLFNCFEGGTCGPVSEPLALSYQGARSYASLRKDAGERCGEVVFLQNYFQVFRIVVTGVNISTGYKELLFVSCRFRQWGDWLVHIEVP